MKTTIFLFLFSTFSFILAAQETNYTTKNDIPYYSEEISRKDAYIRERCMLDIYYPENAKNYPALVWLHGGGLTGGQKEIPAALKEKGIGIIGVNYRLSPKVNVQQCIEDAAAAVSWVFDNIALFGGDPSLIFVSGHSAGGYLTAMIGLDKSWLGKFGINADEIAGLIPLSAQTITHFTRRKETGITDKQPVIDNFAPLYHVRPDAPPMLLITGDRELELLGRYEENAYLMRMMKVSGHKDTRLYELDGYGHGMTEPAFPLLLKEVKRITKEKKSGK
jgi:acetyl esterase/lipase